jgi:NTE family protein
VARSATREPVALVLAGGGARGAYEAGALSVLLPVLEARGERPRVLVGTSAGALNVSFVAANAHRPVDEIAASVVAEWETMRWGKVVRPLLSPASLLRAGEYAAEFAGLPRARLTSLLDPEPLTRTLGSVIDCGRLADNVTAGLLDAVAVVATSALTGRSVVFHCGLASPPTDRRRAIDYVATPIGEEQILASAAIPGLFPAVNVTEPERARGWYTDGGTRLNTPIKPALALGAARVVVIALNSLAPGPARLAGEHRPDALEGVGQILVSLLGDQLVTDMRTLATINDLVAQVTPGPAITKRRVPYIVVAPAERDSIAQRALRVIRERYRGPLAALRAPDIALLDRALAGGTDAAHAELLCFLLVAPEFARALIALGREDAQRWCDGAHDDGIWQVGPLP